MHFHWSFWHLSHCRDFTLSVITIPHPPQDGRAVAAFGLWEVLPAVLVSGEFILAAAADLLSVMSAGARLVGAVTAEALPLTLVATDVALENLLMSSVLMLTYRQGNGVACTVLY